MTKKLLLKERFKNSGGVLSRLEQPNDFARSDLCGLCPGPVSSRKRALHIDRAIGIEKFPAFHFVFSFEPAKNCIFCKESERSATFML
ncbi:MAG: hypothetical protein N2B03_00595 [Boseongicola sp.]